MSESGKAREIRWLYLQGLTQQQICERLKTSKIFTMHTIKSFCDRCPGTESDHLTNMRIKGRRVAHTWIINDDPHFEKGGNFYGEKCIIVSGCSTTANM